LIQPLLLSSIAMISMAPPAALLQGESATERAISS